MATYTTTAKWLLRKLAGSSNVSEIDDGIGALADDIDGKMMGHDSGLASAKGAAGKRGRVYWASDTSQLFFDTGAAWLEIGVSPWQTGDLKFTWLTTAPTGWLLCDGAAVSRITYSALYAAIGDSAGAGNGSTTFNVPDFRGRTFVMPDGAGGRMVFNDSRGASGGAERVTLTESELPAHDHGTYGEEGSFGAGGTTIVVYDVLGGGTNPQLRVSDTAGGGGAHENMPPYLVGGAVLIKT